MSLSNSARTGAALAAALIGFASGPLWAAPTGTTFKCKDAKGKWHYGDKLPPECAKQSSTELSKGGVPLREVEGELTPEQLAAREAAQKKKAAEDRRALDKKRHDKALMTTYNSVEEIDRAREKNLRQVEDTIRGIQEKITDTQQRQRQMQKELDAYKGKKAPADLTRSIDEADGELRTSQQLVVAKRKELDAIRARFDEERRTYVELTRGADAAAESGGKTK